MSIITGTGPMIGPITGKRLLDNADTSVASIQFTAAAGVVFEVDLQGSVPGPNGNPVNWSTIGTFTEADETLITFPISNNIYYRAVVNSGVVTVALGG